MGRIITRGTKITGVIIPIIISSDLHKKCHSTLLDTSENDLLVSVSWETSDSVPVAASMSSSLRYFDHRGIDIEEAEDAALSLQNLEKRVIGR